MGFFGGDDDDGAIGGVKRKSPLQRYQQIQEYEEMMQQMYADAPSRAAHNGDSVAFEANRSEGVGSNTAIERAQENQMVDMYYSDGVDLLDKSKGTDKPIEETKESYGRDAKEEEDRRKKGAVGARIDLIGAFAARRK